MKLRLLILLAAALAASPAAGQTVKSLGYNTTNGFVTYSGTNSLTFTNSLQFATNARAATRTNLGGTTVGNSVFTATNAAAAASAVGLGTTNTVTFADITGDRVYASEFRNLEYNFEVIPEENVFRQNNNTIFSWTSTNATFPVSVSFATNVTVGGTFAVSGDTVLSGVNNTMPNATNAASGSSLMTRDLIYPENVRENSGDMIFPFSSVAVGGSAGNYITAGNSAQITTTTNSYAGCYFGEAIAYQAAYSGSPMQSLKVMDLTMKGVMLNMETNANYVLRVAAGVGTPTRVVPLAGADALSARGWGVNFFYNGTNRVYQPFWYTTNYNTGAAVTMSPQPAQNNVFTIRLRQETNGTIKFWINDGLGSRLSETPTFSTNVTWGASVFGGRFFAIEAASATNAAPTSLARIHYRAAYIKYEP